MKTVGVREFRDQATTQIASGETIVIERQSEPIGFIVPIAATDRREGRAALGRLGELVASVLDETGVSEDELVNEAASGRRRR